MKHLHNYESLNESKDMDTIKKQVLDFAERTANLNGETYRNLF